LYRATPVAFLLHICTLLFCFAAKQALLFLLRKKYKRWATHRCLAFFAPQAFLLAAMRSKAGMQEEKQKMQLRRFATLAFGEAKQASRRR
jgi:hypothetical protein